MKIRRLAASFGNLQNSELKLGGGLNIIEAPNESGKSTWCAFIRAMLYGINTSARDRQDALADKTRYRPWSGCNMEGEMDVSFSGRDITLRRTGTASSPMKRFSAVYSDTGDTAPFTGTDVGEKLTGATESVFERTAFIRQAGIRVDQAYELEKRIASLVSSGDEQTSHTEAEKKLKEWRRALRHNKSGALPRLEERLAAASEKLSMLENGVGALTDLRAEIKRLEGVKKGLEADLKAHAVLEERAAAKRVLDARKQAESCRERLEAAKKAAEPYADVTREGIDDLKADAAAIGALKPVYMSAKAGYQAAQAERDTALTAKKAAQLASLTEQEAAQRVSQARRLEADAKTEEESAKKRPLAVTLGPVLLAVLAAIVAAVLRNTAGFVIFGVVLVLSVLTAVLWKPKRDLSSKEALSALLAEFGFTNVEAFSSAADRYFAVCRALENAESVLMAAKQNLDSAESAVNDSETCLLEKARRMFPAISDTSEIPGLVRAYETSAAELSTAETAFSAAAMLYDTVAEGYEGEPDEVDCSYIAQPMRSREDTVSALSRAEIQLSEAKSRYDRRDGELRAFGAPELISGEISAIKADIAAKTEKYDALSLALDVLGEANTDMRTRFSPLISREAGAILESMTGGAYDRLAFDRGFSAEVKSPADAVSRSALSLSAGTVDQLYLSLRLAMCRLLLDGEEKCPIVLDDALANFDDARAGNALRVLKELSHERQVILFTCHTREAEMLSGEIGVNVIRL